MVYNRYKYTMSEEVVDREYFGFVVLASSFGEIFFVFRVLTVILVVYDTVTLLNVYHIENSSRDQYIELALW